MLLLFLNLTALLFLIRHRQTRAKVPVPIVLSISRSSYLSESSPGGVVVWVWRGGGGAEEEEEEEDEMTREEEQDEEEAERGEGVRPLSKASNWLTFGSKRQEPRQPNLTGQTKVTWRRTPGHSTSWTKHVLEVAPCFELQRSDAHRLVRRALQTIENGTFSDDDSLKSPTSAENSTVFLTA